MFVFVLSFSVKGLKVLHLILTESSGSGSVLRNGFDLLFFIPELLLWFLIAPLQLEYEIKIEFVSTFAYVFELEQF